jgi:hypothetical protein
MRSANQRRERVLSEVPTQPLQSFKGWIAVVAHPGPAFPGTESISRFVAKNAVRAHAVTCTVQQVLQFANLLRVEIPVQKTIFPSFFPSFLMLVATFLARLFPSIFPSLLSYLVSYLFSSIFPLLFPFLLPGGFSAFLSALNTPAVLARQILVIKRSQMLNLRPCWFSHVRGAGEGGNRAAFGAAHGALHAEDALAGRESQILEALAILRDNFALPGGLSNLFCFAENIEA